ncbi:protein folding regulator [Anaeramoeba ignava]|uniref:Protein folding regulator n=1 Tax=Anaeramoeba ignava TaxID=1746090 RepID=A0A9Q0R9D1_ANAIG|nr:protein folding regulator [Anaeramoeba ignava]
MSFPFDEQKELKNCIENLSKDEETEKTTQYLSTLQQIVEKIENANLLVKINGIDSVIKFLYSNVEQNRANSIWIIGTCAKNNPKFKKFFLNKEEAFRKILSFLSDPKETEKIKNKSLGTVSALVQHNIDWQNLFMELNGFDTFSRLIENGNQNNKNRAFFFLTQLANDENNGTIFQEIMGNLPGFLNNITQILRQFVDDLYKKEQELIQIGKVEDLESHIDINFLDSVLSFIDSITVNNKQNLTIFQQLCLPDLLTGIAFNENISEDTKKNSQIIMERIELMIFLSIIKQKKIKKEQRKLMLLQTLKSFSDEISEYCCQTTTNFQHNLFSIAFDSENLLNEWIFVIQHIQELIVQSNLKNASFLRNSPNESRNTPTGVALIQDKNENENFWQGWLKLIGPDLFIYQEENEQVASFKLIQEGIKIKKLPNHNLGFEIITKNQNYLIITPNHKEKTRWIETLLPIIQGFQQTIKRYDPTIKRAKNFRHISFQSPSTLFMNYAVNLENQDGDDDNEKENRKFKLNLKRNNKINQENIQNIRGNLFPNDSDEDDKFSENHIQEESKVDDSKNIPKLRRNTVSKNTIQQKQPQFPLKKQESERNLSILFESPFSSFHHLLNKFYHEENYEQNILQEENDQLRDQFNEQQDTIFNLSDNLIFLTQQIQEFEQQTKPKNNPEEKEIEFLSYHEFHRMNKSLFDEHEIYQEYYKNIINEYQITISEIKKLSKENEDPEIQKIINELMKDIQSKIESITEKLIPEEEIEKFKEEQEELTENLREYLESKKINLETYIFLLEKYIETIQEQRNEQSDFFSQQTHQKSRQIKSNQSDITTLSGKLEKKKTELSFSGYLPSNISNQKN